MKLLLPLLLLVAVEAKFLTLPSVAIRAAKKFAGWETLPSPFDEKFDVRKTPASEELSIEVNGEIDEDERHKEKELEKGKNFINKMNAKMPVPAELDAEDPEEIAEEVRKTVKKVQLKAPNMLNSNDETAKRRAELFADELDDGVTEILDWTKEREIQLKEVKLADLKQGYFDQISSSSSEEDLEEDVISSESFEEDLDALSSSSEGNGEEWDESRPFLKRSCLKKSGKVYESRTSKRVWESVGFENDLPKEWDWRNVDGVNYCSPNRNQHIPVYCGSCWVFGTTGALNDRFNVARKNRWPMTMVSPQEIIDCNGKGSCQGGEVGNVLEHAKIQGLVEEGCNVYRATNGECNPFHRCGSCWPDSCFSLTNYTRYYVKEYGSVKGRENIMAEIKKGGPLACAIGATKPFEYGYQSGVYAEKSNLESNHIVSLTGWGVDEKGVEYWIVRNSWGDAWGETGWFRVVTSKYMNGVGDEYNMGIERDCYFADVDVTNLD